MIQLSETWFMEGYIDFELQQYRLLAYLREVNQCFDENKLYPQLADVIFHYNNLALFRINKQVMQDQFPGKLSQINLQRLELVYEQMLADDLLMQELEAITGYAQEKIQAVINNGTEQYEFVAQQTCIEPIGILPLYKDEGYILLRYGGNQEVTGYTYTTTLFEHKNARYRGIRVSYIGRWQHTVTNTFEHIKREIVRNIRTLPNPAVFRIETGLSVPLEETLLPIAKRMLVRQLASPV